MSYFNIINYYSIWVGAILILAELISFVLLWRRSYPIFMNVTIIHFVSGTIAQALAFMYSQVLMNPGTIYYIFLYFNIYINNLTQKRHVWY